MWATSIFRLSSHLFILSITCNVPAILQLASSSGSSISRLHTPGTSEVIGQSEEIPHFIFMGCFSVWNEQYTRLQPILPEDQFDESNTVFSCTEKCFMKNQGETQLAFIRGDQCLCAPLSEFNSSKTSLDNYCNYNNAVHDQNTMGGNLGYSVYCMSKLENDCMFLMNHQVTKIFPDLPELTENIIPDRYVESISKCVKCHSNLCIQSFISPDFDYFPLNKVNDCADFCGSEIQYVDWERMSALQTRNPRPYAILLQSFVPGSADKTKHLPICMCYDGDLAEHFSESTGSCDRVACPGNSQEWCGALKDGEIFASVYCIDKEICGGTTTQTTPSSDSTEETGLSITESMDCSDDFTTTPMEDSTTTEVTITDPPTTSTQTEETSTTSTEDPDSEELTKSTWTEESTETSYSTITTETTNDAATPTTITFITTDHTPFSTESTVTTESPPNEIDCADSMKCRGKIGHYDNISWEACPGTNANNSCSRLIPDSDGTAFWFCDDKGTFLELPDISKCRSTWVRDMEKRLENVTDMDQAVDFSTDLSNGCINSQEHNSQTKYFGFEIDHLASLINATLCKARNFPDKTLKNFEQLVQGAVALDACLINQHEPWRDLTLLEKSYLSSRLMEATEDVLFHLTQVASSKSKYTKVFTPMEQFTAAAETFEKVTGSVSKEPYVFPPDTEPNRESCIKLPVGWTDLLPEDEDKVEIAVISLAPESIAKVMTGTGIFNVNGRDDRMINGRVMSLTVTSSSPLSEKSTDFKINGVRSHRLNFTGKGVEIAFHHAVYAWGDRIYDIPRKLHKGEKRKAVLGNVTCAFWDTKKNMWSTEGCHLVKTGPMETICECFHLTSFAVLMDVHRYVGKHPALNIITLILCPISELALFLTILILCAIRNDNYKIRMTICKHLCFCLFLGNGMILIFLDKNYFYMSDGFCMGVAMAAHYIFLCAFMWMLFEGVQLYIMVVQVFESGKSYTRHFWIIAYGTPVLIIAVTAAIAYMKGDKPYGGDPYCWLVGNYIWAFMVPVATVITVNLIILFIALKTAYQLQHQGQRQKKPTFITDRIRSCRIFFRGCFSLTVILGVTWVVGFFVLMEGSSKIVAAYLFIILNASQGLFIFLFTFRVHIGKVRLFAGRKLSSYFPSLLNSGSTNNSIIIKKPHIISNDKLERSSVS